ncbi:FecR domain-containing protein [Sphingomonas sp. HF-S4]|uniref:FecR domain-containing protein n=1 Tax=Sphingomonas agrestis TaxID=3080540 RepID=A0ABU3Y3U2_9SPHN|nr:FecR domain-containing protein [Sphingomonas sp. HF-S4]MDV3455857.1 FecR domain-containing protein [Sphingomonas sp. HF-S4]
MGTDEDRANEQAAEWLARLNTRSVTTDELEAFYDWRREPGNAERYARVEAIWRQSRTLGDDPDIAQASRDALARPRLDHRSWRPSRRMVLAGAGAIPVAAGTGWLLVQSAQAYETGIGEQLSISLRDGSRIRLNTDSRLRVAGGDASRRVTLDRGEAFFEVKHDPARPFEVRTLDVLVRAAGTRFDIRCQGDTVRVVLAEGQVSVDPGTGQAPARLQLPGDAALVDPHGGVATQRADLEQATSWTSGRLFFRATPLAAAIAEANRYSTLKIELGDPSLGQEKVDGTFESGDTGSLIEAVSAIFDLKKKTEDDRVVLTRN